MTNAPHGSGAAITIVSRDFALEFYAKHGIKTFLGTEVTAVRSGEKKVV